MNPRLKLWMELLSLLFCTACGGGTIFITNSVNPKVLHSPSSLSVKRYSGNSSGAIEGGTSTLVSIQATASTNVRTYTPNTLFSVQVRGFTDAAIQAAIDQLPDGGTLFLPPGTYSLCTSLPIVIAKPLILAGAGWGTVLQLCSSAGPSTDAIVVRPSGKMYGLKLQDFQLLPETHGSCDFGYSCPGRYGIRFDGTSGRIDTAVVDQVHIGNFGGYAIYADGSGDGNGTPRVSTIQYSWIQGGIRLVNAGDSIKILNNTIDGIRNAVDVDFEPGASNLEIVSNNVTTLGGIHIGANAVSTIVSNNEIETLSTTTGSNGAVLDLDGTSSAPVSGASLTGNAIRIINGSTINSIRVNYANSSNITGNDFTRGASPSKDIVILQNAFDTHVGTNLWRSGPPFSNMVHDAGTATQLNTSFFGNNQVLGANTSLQWLDTSGNPKTVLEQSSSRPVMPLGVVPGGSAAPNCDEAHRGIFWYQPGDAGIKDAVEVCAKDEDDVYSWRSIY